MKYAKVKGTEDYYPEDKAVQHQIFSTLRRVANNYGFDEVESSAMESLGLLTAKSGDEVVSQIFTLDKRGSEELGLRFDLTIPITRMFVAKQRELPKPTKWFGLSRMWRYERPQKGRLREFYQLSAELYGSDTPSAVAECINMLISSLGALGLTSNDVCVRVNNRKLLQGIIEQYTNADFEAVVRAIDKKSKVDDETFAKMLFDAGVGDSAKLIEVVSKTGSVEEVFGYLESLGLKSKGSQGLQELRSLAEQLPKGWFEIDLSIARGLAYYTGTVFEVFDREGKFRAIAGGGQYDGLTELLGGEDCAAVGFGLGYSTLTLLLEDKGLLPTIELSPEYFIACASNEARDTVNKIAMNLRRTKRVEVDVTERTVSKQIQQANKVNAKQLIVIGDDELESGSCQVKDMHSGTERTVLLQDLLAK